MGRVLQIKGLLDVGVPTRIIGQILPCPSTPSSIRFSDATPEAVTLLECERDRMTERIQCLTRNRDAIADYLDAVRGSGPDSIGETLRRPPPRRSYAPWTWGNSCAARRLSSCRKATGWIRGAASKPTSSGSWGTSESSAAPGRDFYSIG